MVPAKGVERWVTQRLSHRLGTGSRGGDGVCAGVRFLQPTSLVSLLLGRERDDAWDPDRLVWPLLETIDASLGEPWCTALSLHLGHGRDGEAGELRRNRRYSVAIRLAHLFASYAVQRPALVTDWREGRDTDGAGSPLDSDLLWQAELWRRVLTRIPEDPPDVRHRHTIERLDAGGDGLDLPARLSLFGHTRLPITEVELLAALGRHRDVHLYLPQPSPSLWDALSDLDGVVARDDDTSADRVGHPLLASLGRDARELRRTLRTGGFPEGDAAGVPPDEPATLLGWLQHDLRANHAPTVQERAHRQLTEGDRSLQVHACHGAARQVDVLREVLVGLLEDDPTLEPRDILVMCPDIETFAPLVSAGFGLAPAEGRTEARRPPRAPAPRPARRPGTDQHQPAAAPGRGAPRAQRRQGHCLRRPRPRERRAVPPPVRVQRRRPRPAGSLGGRHQRAVGAGRHVTAAVLDGTLPQQHLALRARPGAAGRRDERRRPPPPRARAPARRRRQQRDRPRRSAGRAPRPAGRLPGRARVGDHGRRVDGRAARRGPRPRRGRRRRRLAAAAARARAGPGRGLVDGRWARAAARRRPRDARVAAGWPTDAGQLPHRHADGVHDGADALGAAPRGLPRRPRRRRLPAPRHRRRRRRPRPPAAHRRARPSQRGPPAVPRRAAGRHRARRHHLHRRQRELRRAPAPRRTPRRAARRRRPHHCGAGPRGDPHPPPAAALRRPQPQGARPEPRPRRVGRPRAAWSGAAAVQLRRVGARRGHGGLVGAAPAPADARRSAAQPSAGGRLARRAQVVPDAPGPLVPARPARRLHAVPARPAGRRDPGRPQLARGLAGRRPPAAPGARGR